MLCAVVVLVLTICFVFVFVVLYFVFLCFFFSVGRSERTAVLIVGGAKKKTSQPSDLLSGHYDTIYSRVHTGGPLLVPVCIMCCCYDQCSYLYQMN